MPNVLPSRSIRWIRQARVAACALCLAGFTAASDPSIAATEHHLAVEGRIQDVITLDLDGDGRRDLAVLASDGDEAGAARRVSIFRHRVPGGFAQTPDVVWSLEPEIVALDSIEADPEVERPAALFSLSADGVRRHRYSVDPPGLHAELVVSAALPQMIPMDGAVARFDFALPGPRGEHTFFVPGFPSPVFLHGGSTAAEAPAALPFGPTSRYTVQSPDQGRSSAILSASYDFPLPLFADQNGDGRTEAVFIDDERVIVIEPPEKAAQPAGERVYPLDLPELAGADASIHSQTNLRLVDLEGDGRLDLVAIQYRETGILELEGRILLFRARSDGALPRTPDQTLELEHAIYPLTQFVDLDGDGSLEIAVPSASIGLLGYLRLMTTKKVSFAFTTLRRGGDGKYDPDDALRDPLTVRLSPDYRMPVVHLADVDGDDLTDIVLGSGQDRVCIRRGRRAPNDRSFGSAAETCFDADPYAEYRTIDLDADGGDEILSFPVSGDERGKLTLFFIQPGS